MGKGRGIRERKGMDIGEGKGSLDIGEGKVSWGRERILGKGMVLQGMDLGEGKGTFKGTEGKGRLREGNVVKKRNGKIVQRGGNIK